MAVIPSVGLLSLLLLLFRSVLGLPAERAAPCDDVYEGYQCQPQISHFWGQYSPYYHIPSTIPSAVPAHCDISFVQVLSRHGARNPTSSKTTQYNATIAKIKANVSSSAFTGAYAFLASYNYTLGADQLTVFGQQEMVNSGIKFYHQYEALTKHLDPFVRSSSEARVVESAQNFSQGYHSAKQGDKWAYGKDGYPYPIVVISEADGSNNTLNHDLCTAFEDDAPYDAIASTAQSNFTKTFIPAIQARLNAALPGANFTSSDTINMMDLCPFNTIDSPAGTISPFCALFTLQDWVNYDYYETLGKYYGYGAGNPLGPTQGVGWTNELIARLTHKPVNDHTSVNHTLDDSRVTFPLSPSVKIFADFSHDNDMTGIFYALGLYNSTPSLPVTSVLNVLQTNGYSAAWTVPFGARAYFEKMTCAGEKEELVRVLVNDRVMPLKTCGGDSLGRCTLSRFVDSLTFAMGGGHWDQCFPKNSTST